MARAKVKLDADLPATEFLARLRALSPVDFERWCRTPGNPELWERKWTEAEGPNPGDLKARAMTLGEDEPGFWKHLAARIDRGDFIVKEGFAEERENLQDERDAALYRERKNFKAKVEENRAKVEELTKARRKAAVSYRPILEKQVMELKAKNPRMGRAAIAKHLKVGEKVVRMILGRKLAPTNR